MRLAAYGPRSLGDALDGVDVDVAAEFETAEGGEATDGEAVADRDVDLALVVEAGVRRFVADPPSAPVVPVGFPGPLGVARADLADLVARHARGATTTVRHPVLSVAVDGEPAGRALADVTLMTDEPARISEYGLEVPAAEGADAADDDADVAGSRRLDAVRADGVVVATPLGSGGYARDAGGPLVHPGAGVAVVPVAPFATRSDVRVLQPPVAVSVVRDDARVALLADDRAVATVPTGSTAAVRVAATASIVVASR